MMERVLDGGTAGARAAGGMAMAEAGEGRPILYLTDAQRTSSALIDALATAGRVIHVSLDASLAGAPAQTAEQLLQQVALLKLERCDVIAHSAFANAALAFAAQAGEGTVEALVLLSPPDLADAELHKGDVDPAAVKCPVMAVFGTRDLASPPSLGAGYRQALPQCHLMFVYDATRDMEIERPQAVAAIIREFLAAKERFIVTTRNGKIYP